MDEDQQEILERFRESILEQYGEKTTEALETYVTTVAKATEDYLNFLLEEYQIPTAIWHDMEYECRKNIVNFTFDTMSWAYNHKQNQNGKDRGN